MLYERLAESLSKGYLPSYFVDEINLLAGYSETYLKKMANHVKDIHKVWNTTKRFNFISYSSQREAELIRRSTPLDKTDKDIEVNVKDSFGEETEARYCASLTTH